MHEEGHAADVEGCLLPCDGGTEDSSGVGGFTDEVRDEEDCLHSCRVWGTFSDPSRSVVDSDLDSSVDGWCYVVGVALYWFW